MKDESSYKNVKGGDKVIEVSEIPNKSGMNAELSTWMKIPIKFTNPHASVSRSRGIMELVFARTQDLVGSQGVRSLDDVIEKANEKNLSICPRSVMRYFDMNKFRLQEFPEKLHLLVPNMHDDSKLELVILERNSKRFIRPDSPLYRSPYESGDIWIFMKP